MYVKKSRFLAYLRIMTTKFKPLKYPFLTFRDNVLRVEIFFQKLNYEQIVTTPAYTVRTAPALGFCCLTSCMTSVHPHVMLESYWYCWYSCLENEISNFVNNLA